MRYALLVALREFAENVKTKGFWIGIAIFPLLILLSLEAEGWLEKAKPARHFVLVDQSGDFEKPIDVALERLHQRKVLEAFGSYVRANMKAEERAKIDLEKTSEDALEGLQDFASGNPELVEQFMAAGGIEMALANERPKLRDDAPPFEEPRREFRRADLPEGLSADMPPAELAEALKPYLKGEKSVTVEGEPAELFAAVLVPADVLERVVRPGLAGLAGASRTGIQYWSANLADDELEDEIERAANEELRQREYTARGLDAASIREVQNTYVPFASLNPKKEAGEEEVSIADRIRQWAPVGFVYILWIAIFTIAQMLLNNTIEEKSNRIIEVLLSSVTSGELMMGKLIGIAGVGLTMLSAWIGALIAILTIKAGPEAEVATELLGVLKTSGLLPAFALYFVLGYLLYAGAFLAIGSVCNTLKEAQNMMGPIMLIMIVPLLTMAFIPKDPNGTLATVMSWIPLYTPFVMMNRAAADPPFFDRVGTLVVLIVSVIFVLWLSGRIFRIGILRTGQPPKLLELVRWVRSA